MPHTKPLSAASIATALATLLLVLLIPAVARASTGVELVSAPRDPLTLGPQGNEYSDTPSISGDGRYVAFWSRASNLVADDSNGEADIFVHDRLAQTLARVSVGSTGIQSNGESYEPSISGDGRYVAFTSWADNLVEGDDNGQLDVFVHDRATGTTTLVSLGAGGSQSSAESYTPSISADGQRIAFASYASNLVPGDSNDASDVFVRDLQAGTTIRVSVDSSRSQTQATGYLWTGSPAISANGQRVAFVSSADNLVANDSNGGMDYFLHDLANGVTLLVSATPGGGPAEATEQAFAPSLSADGRHVAFTSSASNLVAGDLNAMPDVFVRDMLSQSTALASISTGGAQGNQVSYFPSISADGHRVAFASRASNLVTPDDFSNSEVFLRDMALATTTRVGRDEDGAANFGVSYWPALSADGRHVAMVVDDGDFIADDSNDRGDIVVYDTTLATFAPVSRADADGPHASGANGNSSEVAISPDGRYVAFTSFATDLVDTAVSGEQLQLYVRDRLTGATTLESIDAIGAPGNAGTYTPSLSAGGRYLAFTSDADNLVASDTNRSADVFVRDRDTGETTLVSRSTEGVQGSGYSLTWQSSISADGRYIVYYSASGNLVPDDPLSGLQAYLHDRLNGSTKRISNSPSGSAGNSDTAYPSISADGSRVAFLSFADNLVDGDANGANDVFMLDLVTGITRLASSGTNGVQPNHDIGSVLISGDGNTVAFSALADSLVPGDSNGAYDIFVRDLPAGSLERVSVDSSGHQADASSNNLSLSFDGRYVAFDSDASNLVPGNDRNATDVFLHDRLSGITRRMNAKADGSQSNSEAYAPQLSASGRELVFLSWADNLVAGDRAETLDAFLVAGRPASANADLANLVLSTGTLLPTFAPAIADYSAAVDNATSGITVTATAADPSASLLVDGIATTSGVASQAIPLLVGGNEILVLVTAEDGTTSKSYRVNVTRASSGLTASLSIMDAEAKEGDAGSGRRLVFPIRLSRAAPVPVSVTVTALAGSAASSGDFLATSQLLTLPAGQRNASFEVQLVGDAIREPHETLTVELSAAIGANLADSVAVGTIFNDDGPVPIRYAEPVEDPLARHTTTTRPVPIRPSAPGSRVAIAYLPLAVVPGPAMDAADLAMHLNDVAGWLCGQAKAPALVLLPRLPAEADEALTDGLALRQGCAAYHLLRAESSETLWLADAGQATAQVSALPGASRLELVLRDEMQSQLTLLSVDSGQRDWLRPLREGLARDPGQSLLLLGEPNVGQHAVLRGLGLSELAPTTGVPTLVRVTGSLLGRVQLLADPLDAEAPLLLLIEP